MGFPALGAGNVRRSRQVAADWSLWDKSVEDVARGWVGVTGPTGGVADQLYLVQGGCGVELGDGLISNPPVQGRLAPSPWVVAVVMDLCAFRRLVACLTGGEDSGSQTPRHRGFPFQSVLFIGYNDKYIPPRHAITLPTSPHRAFLGNHNGGQHHNDPAEL